VAETTNTGEIKMVLLAGHVRMGDVVDKLRKDIDTHLGSGSTRMIVSMGSVKSLDSSGLGVLVRSLSLAKQKGGTIKLAQVPPGVAQTLQITGIWRLFEIFETDQQALDSFGAPSEP
jgi:anti-sigma B factor antagonist